MPKQLEGESVKVSKIAIGKPGGIDAETDKYDTVVSVYCHVCKNYFDPTHPKISATVDSILLHESAFN